MQTPDGCRMNAAVMARIVRIEPQPNGGGLATYTGPEHLFNGADLRNQTGRITAWCGTRCASVDLQVVEDRDECPSRAALYANLCRRCFLQPCNRRRGADHG
jgi:hypothetical protein